MVPLVVAIVAAIILTLVDWTAAHGMMLSPPGRSSRWRYNKTAPVNYDDNANYCGGFSVS